MKERRERSVVGGSRVAGSDGRKTIDRGAGGLVRPGLATGMAASTVTRSRNAPGVVGHTLSIYRTVERRGV
jgi:hypothetical protein